MKKLDAMSMYYSLKKMNSANNHMSLKVDSSIVEPPEEKPVMFDTLIAIL